MLRVFNSGNVLESWWIKLLQRRRSATILSVDMPCRIINPQFRVHGRADVLLKLEYGGIEVHEIKTISNFGRWLNEPKQEHVNQLQFYLNVLGVETGYIDYINKYAFMHGFEVIDRRFLVLRDIRLFEKLLDRAQELFKTINEDIPPQKERCWKCDGYCLYKEECEEKKI